MHLKHPDPRRRSYPAMAARNVRVRFVREHRGADVSRTLGALNRSARVTDRRAIMPVNEIAAETADFHDEPGGWQPPRKDGGEAARPHGNIAQLSQLGLRTRLRTRASPRRRCTYVAQCTQQASVKLMPRHDG